MKISAEKLAALQRGADFMNSPPAQDLLAVVATIDDILRRAVDPQGRNSPIAARLAARVKLGTATPAEIGDVLTLAANPDFVPPGFLAAFQRLAAAPAAESPQTCYLAALLDHRLELGRWPHVAEGDRHAAKLFPAVMPDPSDPDGKHAFKRLRKQLRVDWLPLGKAGRPRKNRGQE